MQTQISFIAMMNKYGIACASSDDLTMYRLSSSEPLAVAVDPRSPIRWGEKIRQYQRLGDPAPRETLEEYASDFLEFLSRFRGEPEWNDLDVSRRMLVFLGYGSRSIFPSAYTVDAMVDGDGVLCAESSDMYEISSDSGLESKYVPIGDFDRIAPVLSGATSRVRDRYAKVHLNAMDEYVSRIRAVPVLSDFVEDSEKQLSSYDPEDEIYSKVMGGLTRDIEENNSKGIESFSMGDMVTSVETLVNANVRLSSLFHGQRPPVETIREMAVITRPEGMKWIKHSYIFED